MQPGGFHSRALRLLEEVCNLSGANPGTYVSTDVAAQNAEIPNTVQDLDPIVRDLLHRGLLKRPYAGLGTVTITPYGISVVNEIRGPFY